MPSSVGDMATLAQLFEETRPRLLVMLRRRIDPGMNSRIDADDLLHDTFIEARRRWPRFRDHPEMTGYAWLFRIAKDCLIEAWRRHHRACRSPDREIPWPEQSSVQLGFGLIQAQSSPSAAVRHDELREQMKQTLQLLKTADRDVLWMRHYDELSFAEIGTVLDVTENAATVRYVRALRRLKDLWQRIHGREM